MPGLNEITSAISQPVFALSTIVAAIVVIAGFASLWRNGLTSIIRYIIIMALTSAIGTFTAPFADKKAVLMYVALPIIGAIIFAFIRLIAFLSIHRSRWLNAFAWTTTIIFIVYMLVTPVSGVNQWIREEFEEVQISVQVNIDWREYLPITELEEFINQAEREIQNLVANSN